MTGAMSIREMSPGGREMVTSGGEREEQRAWTHDNNILFVLQTPMTCTYGDSHSYTSALMQQRWKYNF